MSEKPMPEQPMSETPVAQPLEFKAEVQQLLRILSHSLYKERDIFLRELISNASDALHRIQFTMLTTQDVLDAEAELAIHVEADKDAGTLTVSDSGIGMTHDELIENLGTIAHSGAMAFLQTLDEGQKLDDIIGQFGVGFYAVFMVADEVRVTSRSFRPDAQAWTWISKGDSTYQLVPGEKEHRGTTIEIRLKEDAKEYASPWRLEQIVKMHSNYVSFPVYVGETVANQQTAIWRQTPSEVAEEEYKAFYRQLTMDVEDPLLHIHVVSDVPVEIHSVLYIPARRDESLMRARPDYGLKLYSRKVLIQEHNKELLPEDMRFVEGVVDSADVPLNVARETVQSNRTIGHIKRALRGRVVKTLQELGDEKPDEYKRFWEAWGLFIKEGVASDFAGRDDLLPLLRFQTTKSGDELIPLSTYVAQMKEGQSSIYFILGDSLQSVQRSPHLDAFRSSDLEVLYLVDPLDAFMVQSLHEFEGKPLANVDDPDLEIPKSESTEAEPSEPELGPEQFGKLIVRFRKVLRRPRHRGQGIEGTQGQSVPPRLGPERPRAGYAARTAPSGGELRSAGQDPGGKPGPPADPGPRDAEREALSGRVGGPDH